MNKEINEIIERHGYNLKLEVGNALSRIEAKNIIDNAIKEAIEVMHCCTEFCFCKKKIEVCEDEEVYRCGICRKRTR